MTLWPIRRPPQIVVYRLDDDTQRLIVGIKCTLDKLLHRTESISRGVAILLKEVKILAADQAALDAAVAQEGADISTLMPALNTLATSQATAFKNLLDKIAANPTAPASDFQTEVDALNSSHSSLQAAIAAIAQAQGIVTTDDPGTQASGSGPTGDQV